MASFEISKTLFGAIKKLSVNDQGRVMAFIGRFYENPENPGVSFERITSARDEGMWSARISQGLRAVVHKAGELFTLLYAGEHDEAYRWARTRRLETHPVTRITQIIEVVEEVQKDLETIAAPIEAPLMFVSVRATTPAACLAWWPARSSGRSMA